MAHPSASDARATVDAHVRYLVVGAGVSGLAFANFVDDKDLLILEADSEIGGYCKTVVQDGFVWDYSGHFFHFKNPEMERYLLDRMPADEVRVIRKETRIQIGGHQIDFPFQKNIHQLPQADFIACLYDLWTREEAFGDRKPQNFKELMVQRFGRGIADRFLIPYNEKLYACDLATLDNDAMGRFFPWADVNDIIRNFRQSDNASYNATFTYPRGGAIQYVRALKHDVPDTQISLGEALVSVDLQARIATTTTRRIAFEHLVSSAPLPRLVDITGLSQPGEPLSWNKVLVFNLGFDRKGAEGVHWVYFPDRDVSFYRIGYYDNIFHTPRMSLYVELGFAPNQEVDIEAARLRVLEDLRAQGIITDHQLVSWHSVVMDPAYVHITRRGQGWVDETRQLLRAHGVHSIGRYGGWTYCSIEDNMLEAQALAQLLNRVSRATRTDLRNPS